MKQSWKWLLFYCGIVVFQCASRPIKANCRIYGVFIDEQVLYVAKEQRQTTLPFRILHLVMNPTNRPGGRWITQV